MPRRIKDLSSKIKDKIVSTTTATGKMKITGAGEKRKDPPNLHVIKTKLAQNSLVELRLGFDGVEFYSKRDVQSLIKVIEEQFLYKVCLDKHSCLKSICIGWRLPPFALGPILQRVIPLLLQDPIKIKNIQLSLRSTPIPEECLKRIVSWHTLECLDLRSIRISKPEMPKDLALTASSSSSSPSANNHQYHQYFHGQRSGGGASDAIGGCHPSFSSGSSSSPTVGKTENVVKIVPYISWNVKTLRLVDCGLRECHIPDMCEVIRRKLHGLQELSLRHNRDLDGGYNYLFALPCIKSLDLSLCDLDANDGYQIGRAMERNCYEGDKIHATRHLQRLSLAGNYRMSQSIPEVVRLAASRLVELNCSFCDVQSKYQRQVFNILATIQDCTIQSFLMQGTRINDVTELVNCITNNTSIRRLVLDHPREPYPVTLAGMKLVLEAVKLNFSIHTLRLDTYKCEMIWEDMEFWLQLNRCGRSVLLQDNKRRTMSWSTVLAQAAANDDINVMFWLLKHGSVMFTS